jgi:hypothetical protein
MATTVNLRLFLSFNFIFCRYFLLPCWTKLSSSLGYPGTKYLLFTVFESVTLDFDAFFDFRCIIYIVSYLSSFLKEHSSVA